MVDKEEIEAMITIDKYAICSLCGGDLREAGNREYECINCMQRYSI